MKLLLALSFISLTLSSSFLRPLENKQDYDMYVFAIQWGVTMCLSGGDDCYKKLEQIPKNEMSIHGLWPNREDGEKMEECNTGTQIEIVDDGSDVFEFMHTYWPSLAKPDTEFWGHEYNKHGYCYSEEIGDTDYDYKKYFAKAQEVFQENKLNTLLTDAIGFGQGECTLSYTELMEKIGGIIGDDTFVITCSYISGKHYLAEIRVSFDMDFNIRSNVIQGSCPKQKPIYIVYRD